MESLIKGTKRFKALIGPHRDSVKIIATESGKALS